MEDKYSYFQNEQGAFTIQHTDAKTEDETPIAFTDDEEKADFIVKACNYFVANNYGKPKEEK